MSAETYNPGNPIAKPEKLSARSSRRQWIRRGLRLALACALFVAACNAAVLIASSGRVTPVGHEGEAPKRRAAVVLGCAKRLRDGGGNLFFAARIKTAAELWQAGRVEALIVSGDNHVKGYDEPSDMKSALVAAGVPEDRIVCDYAGFRTLDSVVRAKTIFGLDSFLVVSQDFHVRRAVFLGRCRGLDVHGVAAPLPALGHRIRTRNALREALARTAAVLDILVFRRPRFGGPPVPLPGAECAQSNIDSNPQKASADASGLSTAFERLRSAMTWDAITNAMEAVGDSIETFSNGLYMAEAMYKFTNGAMPFRPSESNVEPAWPDLKPDAIAFDDFFPSGMRDYPDLFRRANKVFDFQFAMEFDQFRRKLVAAVDAGSKEQFAVLVDQTWRHALSRTADQPAIFDERFFAAALSDREMRDDVPAVRIRPMLPDEEARLLALAPMESNRLDRFFVCTAWVWANGPKMEFPVVRAESGFSMAAPMLWRFTPVDVEQVGGDPDVSVRSEFASPWQSNGADHFGEILKKALMSGDANGLLDRLCPESRTSTSIAALRHSIALDAANLTGLPFKIRSRFPLHGFFESDRICRWLHQTTPEAEAHASPARFHPGLWLAFDAVVETNGVECPLATFFAVRDKDDSIRLLAPRYQVDDEKPTPGEIQTERRLVERNLRLISSDARFRFLGFLASSLASSSGAKPAFVPIFSFGAAEYSDTP